MDYFLGVVTEYLRRSLGVHQHDSDSTGPWRFAGQGRHWFCDVAAANFREQTLYLCEIVCEDDEFIAGCATSFLELALGRDQAGAHTGLRHSTDMADKALGFYPEGMPA